LVVRVIAVVIVTGVIVPGPLLVTVIAAAAPVAILPITVVTASSPVAIPGAVSTATPLVAVITATSVVGGVVTIIVFAAGIVAAWVRIRGTIGWNIEHLTCVDVIGIIQTVGAGNAVGIHIKSAANAEQGVAITNHIITVTAAAASIAAPSLALRSVSQLEQDNG
jgi:hypothetical protein